MANNRDDFPQKTKDLLGNRGGWCCTNPDCRKPTRGWLKIAKDENLYSTY